MKWAAGVVGGVVVGVGLLTGCAPSAKTVANVTPGLTGCPSESLVIFDYQKDSRNWSASCGDNLYVCSTGRGPARCTPQQSDTVNQELVIRAKALAQLSPEERQWFVSYDLARGDWPSFAELVMSVRAASHRKVVGVDPRNVYGQASPELAQAVGQCAPYSYIEFRVDAAGAVTVSTPTQCKIAIVNSAELGPRRLRKNSTTVLLPGVQGGEPITRPTLAAAPAAAASAAPPLAPAAAPVSEAAPAIPAAPPELDAAVRQWLDKSSTSVLACTGKDPTVLSVKVSAEGKPEVSIRGGAAGAPEEGCVRSALPTPTLPPGPGQILHVVKSGT